MLQFGSHLWRLKQCGFLEKQDIKDGQDAGGIEDGQADEPGQLVVACALPQGDQFPDAIPDGHKDENDDAQDEQGAFHNFRWLNSSDHLMK